MKISDSHNVTEHPNMPDGWAACYWEERGLWAVRPNDAVKLFDGRVTAIPAGEVIGCWSERHAACVAKAVGWCESIIEAGDDLRDQEAWPEDYELGSAERTRAELLELVNADPDILIGLAVSLRTTLLERVRSG